MVEESNCERDHQAHTQADSTPDYRRVPVLRFRGFTYAWERQRLGGVAPLQRGFDLPVNQMTPGPYPVVMSNGIGGWHSKYMVKGPGVVTGRSGTIGSLHYIEQNFWPHNTSLWVTSFNGNEPRFIYWLYASIDVERFGSGSGVPTLNRNDVHDLRVGFPCDVAEQRRIGTFFSCLDSLVALHQRKLTKLYTINHTVKKAHKIRFFFALMSFLRCYLRKFRNQPSPQRSNLATIA